MATSMYIIDLKVISLNINSLISNVKRAELDIFLKKYKPDILLLCETKLNSKHKISFQNYNVIRNDRHSNRGVGTAIIISNKFVYEILPNNLTSASLEYTLIKLRVSNNRSLFLCSTYIYQNHTDLGRDLDALFRLQNKNYDYFVLGGDLNSKHTSWENVSNNRNGNQLRFWLDCNLQEVKPIHTFLPTYHAGNRTPSFLDFYLVNNNVRYKPPVSHSNLLKCLDFASDHKAVEIILNFETSFARREFLFRFDYKKANWANFWFSADHAISNINCPSNRQLLTIEIDETIENLTNAIITSRNNSVPREKIVNNNQLNLPQTTLSIIKYKNSLRRKLYRNPLTQNASFIKSQINCLNVIIKNQIQQAKDIKLKTTLNLLKKDKDVFKKINNITQRKPFPTIPDLEECLNGINHRHITDQDKANCLGRHFQRVHLESSLLGDPQFVAETNQDIRRLFQTDFDSRVLIANFTDSQIGAGSINNITPQNIRTFTNSEEVKCAILDLKRKKSFGFDGVSGFLLKKLPPSFHSIMAKIINNCLNLGYFPKNWKNGKVLAFPKISKNTSQQQNYRPISLLSCISKILEYVVRSRLQQFVQIHNLIPVFQFGFEKGLGPSHAQLVLSNDIVTALRADNYVAACSIDIEKAFDSVWIEGLILKLMNSNFPNFLLHFIFNYISNRTFQVSINEATSQKFTIAAGVPQGSLLAPILFNLYMADIPTSPPNIPREYFNIVMYADDTLLYSSNQCATYAAANLNAYLYYVEKHFEKWKLKINIEKSSAILFRRPAGRKRVPYIDIQINRKKVPIVTKLKFLGVHFTNLFKFSEHVNQTITKTTIALSKLNPILNPCRGTRKEVKILIYKQLVRPILLYGYPIWFNVSRNTIDKICKVERKCIRKCIDFKGPRQNNNKYISNIKIYEDSEVLPFLETAAKQAIKFLTNCRENSNNRLVLNCFNITNDQINECSRYRYPQFILYSSAVGSFFNTDNKVIFYSNFNTRYPPVRI